MHVEHTRSSKALASPVEVCAERAQQGDLHWCTDDFMGTEELGIMAEAAGITTLIE